MTYPKKVVLHCPAGYRFGLDSMVERFLADSADPTRFILMSSHPGQSIADVVEFARNVSTAGDEEAQVVTLDAQWRSG